MLEQLNKLRKYFPNEIFSIKHSLSYNGRRVTNIYILSFRRYLGNDVDCTNLEYLRINVNKLINEHGKKA